jgi:hypothetical protein
MEVDYSDLEFDEEKYYLGNLCKRGHDWNGTGRSLRKHTGSCIECIKLTRKKKLIVCLQCKKEKLVDFYSSGKFCSTVCANKYRVGQREDEIEKLTELLIRKGIDIDKYYLGRLCPRKHDWEGTGYSLRDNHSKCPECTRIIARKGYRNNRDKLVNKQRLYRKNNREHINKLRQYRMWLDDEKRKKKNKAQRDYVARNRDEVNERNRKYVRSEKAIKKDREYREKNKVLISTSKFLYVCNNPEKVKLSGRRQSIRKKFFGDVAKFIRTIEDQEEKEKWNNLLNECVSERILINDLKRTISERG